MFSEKEKGFIPSWAGTETDWAGADELGQIWKQNWAGSTRCGSPRGRRRPDVATELAGLQALAGGGPPGRKRPGLLATAGRAVPRGLDRAAWHEPAGGGLQVPRARSGTLQGAARRIHREAARDAVGSSEARRWAGTMAARIGSARKERRGRAGEKSARAAGSIQIKISCCTRSKAEEKNVNS
jgi:hypothetical protein